MSVLALAAFAVLIALGTWQLQRLAWKEALIATISERVASPPRPLSEIEALAAETGDVEYWPIEATGTFKHEAESHFLATWQGQSGFYVYTPFELGDGKAVFVNRGFVPYDRKDPATRTEGQIEGRTSISGLARNTLAEKPSIIVPDNDPAKNIFYWKDIAAMTARAGLASGTQSAAVLHRHRQECRAGRPAGRRRDDRRPAQQPSAICGDLVWPRRSASRRVRHADPALSQPE